MAKRTGDDPPGYGRLLDAWVAPEDAGDAIGCLATTFTFSPSFFEEECLSRFLHLESDPAEDGPVYLVEREEKLAQLSCAAVLVDPHHCRGSRSLRWDLISARRLRGLQHAKVSLLYWARVCRVIIGSANLTEDGYRRNLEVYGVVDFRPEGDAPVSCLTEVIAFLRHLGESSAVGNAPTHPRQRWNRLLDRVSQECVTWGTSDQDRHHAGVHLQTVFSGPGYPSVFESLRQAWPGGSPPDQASVVSPFFDPPETDNAPARALWNLLRRRGEATTRYFVMGEEVPGEDRLFLHAPESLLQAEPASRPGVRTDFFRVTLPENRPLHAKGIRLEDARWTMYQIGSSNFSSSGTGLSKTPNWEANLLYTVDSQRESAAHKALRDSFPGGTRVDLDADVLWKPRTEEDEEESSDVLLPTCFGEATFDVDAGGQATILLSITGSPPPQWEISVEGTSARFWGESDWWVSGRQERCLIPWDHPRPPSGFWVRWAESPGAAWWPVNVSDGEVLPPPDELKHLPLDVLINILSSARPLHRVLKEYLQRRRAFHSEITPNVIVDPHKRVDTSRFLLQRTRRISGALLSLRKRLETPVATVEFLRWRLRGPVGVMALAEALDREAHSDAERSFLLSELLLELSRVQPARESGCLDEDVHRREIRSVITDLIRLWPELGNSGPDNLRRYIASIIAAVGT